MAFTASFAVTVSPRAPAAPVKPGVAAGGKDFASLLNDATVAPAAPAAARSALGETAPSLPPAPLKPALAAASVPVGAAAPEHPAASAPATQETQIQARPRQETAVSEMTLPAPTASEASAAPGTKKAASVPASSCAQHKVAARSVSDQPAASPPAMLVSPQASPLTLSLVSGQPDNNLTSTGSHALAPATPDALAAQTGGAAGHVVAQASTPLDDLSAGSTTPQSSVAPAAGTERATLAPSAPAEAPNVEPPAGTGTAQRASVVRPSAMPAGEQARSAAPKPAALPEAAERQSPTGSTAGTEGPAMSMPRPETGTPVLATSQALVPKGTQGSTVAGRGPARTMPAATETSRPSASDVATSPVAIHKTARVDTGEAAAPVSAFRFAVSATVSATAIAPAATPAQDGGSADDAEPAESIDHPAAMSVGGAPPLPAVRTQTAPDTLEDAAPETQESDEAQPSAESASGPVAAPQAQPPVQPALPLETEAPRGATRAPAPSARAATAATPRSTSSVPHAQPEALPAPATPAYAPASHESPPTEQDPAPVASPTARQGTDVQPHAAGTASEPAKVAVKPGTAVAANTDESAPATFTLPDAGTAPPVQPATPDAQSAQTGATQATTDAKPPAQASQAAAPEAAPATQLAHAVASLHVGADGTSHTTIKLDPVELGQVQIRISRAQDGTSSISVAVERPDTLASLQNDLGHLHQALDRAGVSEQRSVTLHLAGADQAGSQSLGSGAGGMAQGGSQQGARQDRQQSGALATAIDPRPSGTEPAPAAASPALSRNAGVNITA